MQAILINALLALLLDKRWRDMLMREVSQLMNVDISGTEKHRAVRTMLQTSGLCMASHLLNLVIELAVARLKR